MSGYQCDTCRNVFSTPNTRRELDHIDGGTAQYVIVNSCPDCGTDDPRQVALCIDCLDSGVDVLATHDDYCQSCAALNGWEFKRDNVAEVKPLVRQ